MLLFLSIVKLICEIALMSLLGQWIVGLLAGQKREQNLFYQVLAQIGRPFVFLARFIAPRSIVLDRHVPLVAFLVLAFVWVLVTGLRIQQCIQIGVENCK
ncbi:MAG: hypothetical protein MUE35_12955 [Hydrogenophaga sp.]|nr:hypothetical protein [Hydrogenophaga sp.]